MGKDINWLLKNIDKENLADILDDDKKTEIARKVCIGYQLDLDSRKEWEDKALEGLKIARQITEKKTYPFTNAANIKYPLIAIAAINFAARVYPEIIQGSDVVKAQIIGQITLEKEQRAKRVGQHMSFQLIDQMTEWEGDTDQLFTSLPVVGMWFRKTYYDTLLQRNRSIGLSPMDLVVNQKIKDLLTARRITEKVFLYKNDVIERERAKLFCDVSEFMEQNDEEDKAELFLEQHTWLDLDEDGYAEPYIVTVYEPDQKLARIVANYEAEGVKATEKGKVQRIESVAYYTDYGFLPDPQGGFYKIGFSHLLGPINESISTVINQLLDAGHWANTHNGFLAQGIKVKGGKLTFEPNEWKMIETPGSILKDSIVPLPTKEPSSVLMQLLALLIETGKTLSSVSETMTGEMPGQNTPATTVLAMIEQGLKVFGSIYKRVFRSLKSEYKKLYRLNRLYMSDEEYFRVMDNQMAILREDYDADDMDIIPVADPSISSEAQRLARARALMDTMQINPCPSGRIALLHYYYDAIQVPDIEKFLPPEEVKQSLNAQPPPDPQMVLAEAQVIKMQAEEERAEKKLLMEQVEMEAKVELLMAQVKETNTKAIKNIAEAESKEAGIQIDSYKAMADAEASANSVDSLKAKAKGEQSDTKQAQGNIGGNESGGVSGMEAPPVNAESPQVPEGDSGMVQGEPSGGFDIESQLRGTDGGADYSGIGSDARAEFNSRDAV